MQCPQCSAEHLPTSLALLYLDSTLITYRTNQIYHTLQMYCLATCHSFHKAIWFQNKNIIFQWHTTAPTTQWYIQTLTSMLEKHMQCFACSKHWGPERLASRRRPYNVSIITPIVFASQINCPIITHWGYRIYDFFKTLTWHNNIMLYHNII